MINKFIFFALAAPAIILSAEAQQALVPGPNGVIVLDASKQGMTRIAFERDRVASVQKIADGDPEGDFSASKDDATGDLYIVIGADAKPNLSFFVTTETGETYQIMMRVLDVPTLQVRVAAPEQPIESPADVNAIAASIVEGDPSTAEPSRTPVVNLSSVLIRAMYSGARVEGFETRRYRRLDWLNDPITAQGFSQRGVIEWTGNDAVGYAITLRNETTEPRAINYGRLAVFNVVAATGDQGEIPRRGTAQIFLVVKGGAS